MSQSLAQDAPQALAERVADAMWPRDRTPQLLGMRLLAIGPGTASVQMEVREDMTNGHLTCHGGVIFALADTAFAYACNSYNRNTVAAGCQIDFLSPAQVGEVLEAEAQEQVLVGRSGVYDVTVRTPGGRVVALFRGKAARINGEVLNASA